MICQLIVSKTVSKNFLIIFLLRFINTCFFIKNNFRNRKSPKFKTSGDQFIIKKFPHIFFKILSAQINRKNSFSKKIIFQGQNKTMQNY